MDFGLSTIGQIAITVSQVDDAIAFYRDKLGMKLLFQVPNMGFFDCGGIRLMLTGVETPGESHSSILYFKVADIEQAQQEFAARGVIFEREPGLVARMPDHDLWMTFFRDLDRNLLALMSEVPRSGTPDAG
jgi:catechol 2,3-dioxygenase-like lactoylglutathione lyase family enzyme